MLIPFSFVEIAIQNYVFFLLLVMTNYAVSVKTKRNWSISSQLFVSLKIRIRYSILCKKDTVIYNFKIYICGQVMVVTEVIHKSRILNFCIIITEIPQKTYENKTCLTQQTTINVN